jgi:hypothetical protein
VKWWSLVFYTAELLMHGSQNRHFHAKCRSLLLTFVSHRGAKPLPHFSYLCNAELSYLP